MHIVRCVFRVYWRKGRSRKKDILPVHLLVLRTNLSWPATFRYERYDEGGSRIRVIAVLSVGRGWFTVFNGGFFSRLEQPLSVDSLSVPVGGRSGVCVQFETRPNALDAKARGIPACRPAIIYTRYINLPRTAAEEKEWKLDPMINAGRLERKSYPPGSDRDVRRADYVNEGCGGGENNRITGKFSKLSACTPALRVYAFVWVCVWAYTRVYLETSKFIIHIADCNATAKGCYPLTRYDS